ncbi:MAG: periplasmic heavy metal sensor [Proteobacteria bacterium]|nr:periplasmic heavy metal sensor [Pseudomonadota bacterium]
MKKRLLTTITVLALVSLSAFAIAAPRGGRGPAAAEPALTPEKQAAVAKIVDKHHTKLVELREKIWAKHTELQALSQAGKAEKADIQNLIAEISKLRTSMNEERDALRSEIEKETGIKSYGRGYHRGGLGGGDCSGGGGDCPRGGSGQGYGPRGGMMGGGY